MKQVVTLIETPAGWLWAERGHVYGTLVQAVRAVGAELSVITYQPRSRIGRALAGMFAKGEMS